MSPQPAPRILGVLFAYNEEKTIGHVIERLKVTDLSDLLVIDDGSTDGTTEILRREGIPFLRNPTRQGLGMSARKLVEYIRAHQYDIVVTLAANGKDDPGEIPQLLKPILEDGYDMIQGSRYLVGGRHANMPLYRWIGTRFVYPFLFFLLTRRWLTDPTNGFRAFRTAPMNDPRIDIYQDWLREYELEPYILYKAVTLEYRMKEVPVTKLYPNRGADYTKMKPVTGWWSILRPIVLLGLRIKR
jgi:dolichol-phosphate mannosyltransferase